MHLNTPKSNKTNIRSIIDIYDWYGKTLKAVIFITAGDLGEVGSRYVPDLHTRLRYKQHFILRSLPS